VSPLFFIDSRFTGCFTNAAESFLHISPAQNTRAPMLITRETRAFLILPGAPRTNAARPATRISQAFRYSETLLSDERVIDEATRCRLSRPIPRALSGP
jgi:hypothetical protein